MEQNRDFPQTACIAAIRVQVPQPLRPPAQKRQRQDLRRLRARDDCARRQQRFRHGRGANVERPQHARCVAAEAMIPMSDMRQRVGGQGVCQLGRCRDQPLEG